MAMLDNKVAIVTGASRGIGKDVAAMFAAEGARVVITARTLEEGSHPLEGSLNTTVDEIRAAGGEITAIAGDLSEYEACERLVQQAHDAYGPVDVLVNNAVDAHAPHDATHERILQEAREPGGRRRVALRVVELHPDAQDAEDDARDRGGDHEPALDDGGCRGADLVGREGIR